MTVAPLARTALNMRVLHGRTAEYSSPKEVEFASSFFKQESVYMYLNVRYVLQ
jgi:hypothetical protein